MSARALRTRTLASHGPVGSFHLSNLLTYLSLIAGVCSVAAALQSSAAGAGAWLAAAALLDTFDGRFARRFARTPAVQAIGAELDSLTDAVVFGVAPIASVATLLTHGHEPLSALWWIAAAFYAAAALTRLAHFNVAKQHEGFVGLPTPVAALVWSTMLLSEPGVMRSSMVAVALGTAMIAPFAIARPRGRGLSIFAAWPAVLIAAHLARLS